jgi:long-subunit acyl-CoA synthetase (AMP-forming)
MTVKFRQNKIWPIDNPKVMYMTNRDILHPMAQFATWHLNGVCIPVSSSCSHSELEYFIKQSGVDLVVCHQDFIKKFESFKVPVYGLSDSDINLQAKALVSRHAQVIPAAKDAMLIYTSGTTGNPKGAIHTHGSLEAMMV